MPATASPATTSPADRRSNRSGFWKRQISAYPDNGRRALYLGIVVLATVVLYYELYIQGAVATKIISYYGMSLAYFIVISVVGNAVGALGSLAAGLADRWGRADLVVYGLGITGVLMFLLPQAGSKTVYLALFAMLSVVEGVILVATPALIRDFSPQLGRAVAMGFWTLGPVIGSLVVTEVSSNTLDAHPDWQFQFRVCGIVGLVVFAIAFVGLRELSPQLRDQLMVSLRDRALIEARAKNIDPEQALHGQWRQMRRLDVVGSAFAIAVFLLFYYIAVGFFVVFLATTFGYSEARANSLANWYWIANAIALVVTGVLSDLLRVRKPFMVVGGVLSAVGVALFAIATGDAPDAVTGQGGTSYYHFATIIILIAVGQGIAFASWMAGFTETVESHNPAATATGLAVWGSLIRTVVTVALIGLILAVSAAGTLVDKGPRVQELAARYPTQLATLQQLDPATQAALAANPADQAAQVKAVSQLSKQSETDVVKAITLSAKFPSEIDTASAIDDATKQALFLNAADQAAAAEAVAQIAQKFGISPAESRSRLLALAAVPVADLLFLNTAGEPVRTAAAALTEAGSVPRADLAYLQANAADVRQAVRDSPGQWQRWWWICFAGQLLFLPIIALMAGRWSPRAAKADADAHDAAVSRELAAMQQA